MSYIRCTTCYANRLIVIFCCVCRSLLPLLPVLLNTLPVPSHLYLLHFISKTISKIYVSTQAFETLVKSIFLLPFVLFITKNKFLFYFVSIYMFLLYCLLFIILFIVLYCFVGKTTAKIIFPKKTTVFHCTLKQLIFCQ